MPDLAIEASDRPLRSDQYTYVETHAWWMGTFGRHTHLTEHRLRQWVPARTDREWLLVRELTGAQRWLIGSAEEAADDGFELRDVGPVGRFVARHGRFELDGAADEFGEPPCAPPPPRRGSWQAPTPAFFADLPRDPDELRARLVDENPGNWFGPFAAAVNVLRTALVPASLRTALYGALLGLPDVTRRDGVCDVDGRPCIAVVHDAGRTCTELLIAPEDGQFAGERDTLRTDSRFGLPAGTVISTTAVRTSTVDGLGELPHS
ncbi:hypothetical protein ACQEVB_01975 [Pseudonocardia sp. CA-107938]|uniref:hypothetical protein n=1 Tax=Pseudonocardia sp. CA-107938 TaxID=3240021 RepID=UPI003D8C5A78